MRDPYKTLGVKRDAGTDEIKTAWRNLAKAVHPDHNQNDPTATERFAEIGRAYETLKDPKKRGRYDQIVRMAEATGQSTGQTIMQQRQAAREAAERAKQARANAEKVMEELARANAARAAKAAAAASVAKQASASTSGTTAAAGSASSTAHTQASAGPQKQESPEEVVERIFGSQAKAVPKDELKSSGMDGEQATAAIETGDQTDAGDAEPALASGGIGSILSQPLGILSSFVRRITGATPPAAPEKAPDIAAEATIGIDDILQGNWITVTLSDGRDVRFQAAPGMSDGHVVHLKGQGLKLQGLQRGDLAITVHMAEDARFRISGFDIHTILPVTIENAVLGWRTKIEGPRGPVDVTVPAWSSSDQVIRIASGGMPDGNGAKGDLVVELRLMLWDKPDDKVTDLMRSMKDGLVL